MMMDYTYAFQSMKMIKKNIETLPVGITTVQRLGIGIFICW